MILFFQKKFINLNLLKRLNNRIIYTLSKIPDYDLDVNPHLIYQTNVSDYDLFVNPYLIEPNNLLDKELKFNSFLPYKNSLRLY